MSAKECYATEIKTKSGKLKKLNYDVPEDPWINMLSYIYCWKHNIQYYTIARKLPPILKMHCWGQEDFVAIPEYDSEFAYEYNHGMYKREENEFYQVFNNGEESLFTLNLE